MRINKVILSLILMCIGLPTVASNPDDLSQETTDSVFVAQNATEIFCSLPKHILELIPTRLRRDMTDYYLQADSIHKVTNNLGGTSHLIDLTDDYLKVQVTDVSTMEIKMLPFKEQQIAAVVYTVCGEAADSKISFIDEYAQELKSEKFFKAPQLKDFFSIPRGSLTTMKEIEQMVGFCTIEYRLNASDNSLHAYLTIDKHINQDDYNIIKLFMLDSLVYDWNGKKYIKRKQ